MPKRKPARSTKRKKPAANQKRARSSKRRKSAAKKKRSRASQAERVPPRQWRLPAGFKADGTTMVTLQDLLSLPEQETKRLDDLTETEQADLTAERLRNLEKFSITLVGVGVLNKEDAIREVKAHTSAGKTLVEIEKRTLEMVIGTARAHPRARGGR